MGCNRVAEGSQGSTDWYWELFGATISFFMFIIIYFVNQFII
jgi:hypothetical protein